MKLLNKEIEITEDDILANIYFIAEMAQISHQKGMYVALAGKKKFGQKFKFRVFLLVFILNGII